MDSFCRWKSCRTFKEIIIMLIWCYHCRKKESSGWLYNTLFWQDSGWCVLLHSYFASVSTHRDTVRRFQYHWHWHLPLKIQFCQVKNLLSHNPFFFHATDAVQSEANCVIPNHLRLNVMKFESLCEDRAWSPLDAGFCSLLLYGEKN